MDPHATTPLPPEHAVLHRLFQARARETPGAPAVLEGEGVLSFGELAERSRRVAAGLGAEGVTAGALVGVHQERSADWVVTLLGVLQAGAAVVPLPPSYPQERRREIVEHGRIRVVVEGAETPAPDWPGVRRLRQDALEEAQRTRPPPPHAGADDPDAPAFVLSSSGSTGRPKMIVRSHRSFFHRLAWTWWRHPFQGDDLGCQKAHMSTTHSVYELFEPLLAGAPTLLVPDARVRDLEGFWEVVARRGVTRLLIVPSALRASLDMPEFRPPPLRVVVLMGEYVPPDLAQRAREAFAPDTALYSIYGSTEASSTLVVDLRAASPEEELPLGAPLTPDVEAMVLRPDGRPVAEGEVGRLYVSGTPLFSGYLGDDDLTRSVLVPVPGRPDPAYDTRDAVRFRADGRLEFVGRVDHTVKVRGFRVDLEEVERVMRAHPGVRQAVAVVEGEGAAGRSLLGFYVPSSVPSAGIYEVMRARLPDYMVPSTLTGLDELPLTASSKVDRQRLAALHAAAAPPPAVDDPPRTPAEQKVAEAWAATLGHGAFGRSSSFFEVGGTSLTSFALVHRLRRTFGLGADALPGEAVYRFPTVETMARHIEGGADVREGGTAAAGVLATLRSGRDVTVPPLFLVASAGGTLGAYERLARVLDTPREIIGLRDPMVWGARDPERGFDDWVEGWVEAVRGRQPHGPYYVCAYSSAGAFGLEIAQRLRAAGEEVGLLTLVDPLALDRSSRRRYGFWALRATWGRRELRWLVRAAGRARTPWVRMRARTGGGPTAAPFPPERIREVAREALRDRGHLLLFSALLELNTGLPFALDDQDVADVADEDLLGVLQARVAELTPELDSATLARIVSQYALQVHTQHRYRMRPYDGRALLVEPTSPYRGLVAELLRPYVRRLEAHALPLDAPPEGMRRLLPRFGPLHTHYRSMRDERFVEGLARILTRALDGAGGAA